VKMLTRIPETVRWFRKRRAAGRRIVLVPTMGAMHAGHLRLIRRARVLAGRRGILAVSLFVNPAQFGPREDFRRYPRPIRRDRALCRISGVDVLFAPRSSSMYAGDASTWVDETRLSRGLCGRSRPGHFRGVCTIVAKLFHIVTPDLAIFGRKDFQQAAIIRRMIRDLNFPVRLVVAPTVREKTGLACSSRNTHLTPAANRKAPAIRQALLEARHAVHRRPMAASRLRAIIRRRLRGFRIDYIEVVDATTLEPRKTARSRNCVALAAHLGNVRLIDNIIL
jgi:pantoate--beta-alanine ligase